MAKQFLTMADTDFLNLQSGNASPYFYVEAIISGITSVLADSFTSTNWLIDGGVIDREKPIFPGDRSNIFSSDVTIKVDNSTRRFSPKDSSSVFFGNDYLDSPVNYWAGFLNVSGTALLLQRGAFNLENLKLDSRQNIAYMRLRDRFKKPLDQTIAGPLPSGTSTQFTITGVSSGDQVISSLCITGASLTAGDLSLQTASITFNSLSLSEQKIANALALVSEAADGFMYTSRRGLLTFTLNEPLFVTSSAVFTITESNYAMNIFYEETKDDLIYKTNLEFQSGTSVSISSDFTGTTGNTITISNDCIQSTAEAVSIAGRIRGRFLSQITRLEIDSVWLPSLDINDVVSVNSTGLGLSAALFQIYKVQEEITQGTMRFFLATERNLKDQTVNKFAFFSDPSAVDCGTIFTGATGEANGWRAHYGFFATEITTAVNPGFDADGNNNNVINTGVTSSGAGGTGIEIPFIFY